MPVGTQVGVISNSKMEVNFVMRIVNQLNLWLRPFKKWLVIRTTGKDVPSPGIWASPFCKIEQGGVKIKYKGLNIFDVTNTNSMDPCIDAGHKLLVIPSPPREVGYKRLKKGDWVIFHRLLDFNLSVAHRIISIIEVGGKNYYKCKGDNCLDDDGWIPYEYIKFVVVGVVY